LSDLSCISILKEFFNLTIRITIEELKKLHVIVVEWVNIDFLPFSSSRLMGVLVCGFQLGTLRRRKCLLGKRKNNEFEIGISIIYNEIRLECFNL